MIIMVAGAMGVGKTTFCRKYAIEENFTYRKCQLDADRERLGAGEGILIIQDEINELDYEKDFILDGCFFKEAAYGMTVGNITVPYEIWGLFAPPKIVLERFKQKSSNPNYDEELIMSVQSKLINLVDKAIWNI